MNTVDYKDSQVLRRFMSPHAKILNHKRTGTCPKHQRMISLALKRARHMALLPFVAS
jgi:small subunit ribosomal protein S18